MVSFKLATRIAPRGHLAAEKRGEGFLFCFWGLREDSQSFPSGGPVNNTVIRLTFTFFFIKSF